MPLTYADLQPLLAQFKGDGRTVSCYIDVPVLKGFQARWSTPFKAKVAEIKEMLADDPPAWREFERNFEAVGQAVEVAAGYHPHGLAVFSALQRGFSQSYALESPVENALVLHQAPYLVPLLEALCRQREYLVVLTDNHRGRLYVAAPGELRLLHEIEEAVPRKQHSAGECWGTGQATIARHREDRILHYHKELIERIVRTWEQQRFRGIVLLGEHETLEHVRKKLPRGLDDQVVYEGPHVWTDDALAVAGDVRKALGGATAMAEKRIIESVEDRSRHGYGIAAGPSAIVDALQSGRLGAPRGQGYLVLGPDPREAVSRCTGCRSLFVDMPPVCPQCQAPCVDANLWEEILLLALRHEIVVHCVDANPTLARCGGVAAVISENKKA
jgi:hypothetical protein